MVLAVQGQSSPYQLRPMEFIDEHPVFCIVFPIITTLGIYLLTAAPSFLILGMLTSTAVVVTHFLPHENQVDDETQELVDPRTLSRDEQYECLQELLIPLSRIPKCRMLTHRFRETLVQHFVQFEYENPLAIVVSNWNTAIILAELSFPEILALREAIEPYVSIIDEPIG